MEETRYDKRVKELEGCRLLEDGWTSYNAPAPSWRSIELAKAELDRLYHYTIKHGINNLPDKIVPMTNGGIYFFYDTDIGSPTFMEFQNK